MKIKKVDDKPMVIHTKRKVKIHTHEAKDRGFSRFKRNIKEANTSIKKKNTNFHIVGRIGALATGVGRWWTGSIICKI